MFPTLPETAEGSEEKDKELTTSAGSSRSSDVTDSDRWDAIVEASAHDVEAGVPSLEKTTSKTSVGIKRPALSRVASRITTHSITDPGPPPDGGLKAWTQVMMGWLAIVTTWGWVNCFGVFQTYYTLHLNISPSDISWIGTIQTFLTFFIGAFSGRLLDAGYYWPTILIGMVIQLVGIFTMSLATKYWQLILTQGVLTGLGGGLFFTPCMAIVATYFSKKRAFAMGCSSTGNSAGGLLYPVLVRELLPRLGFAWTVRVLGFVNLAFMALIIAFERPRLPPRKSGPIIDWHAFTEAPYALFVISVFFQTWCIYFTLYYVSSFGVEKLGMSFTSSTTLLMIVNGIGVPARLLPGFIADKCGQLNIQVPVAYCFAAVAWCWLAVHNISGIYVFVCFYGLSVAAFQCLIPPTTASLTQNMTVIGSRLGMVFACMGFGALTGPPIGGAIISSQGGNYIAAQSWSAASCLLSAIVLTFCRQNRTKGKLKAKV